MTAYVVSMTRRTGWRSVGRLCLPRNSPYSPNRTAASPDGQKGGSEGLQPSKPPAEQATVYLLLIIKKFHGDVFARIWVGYGYEATGVACPPAYLEKALLGGVVRPPSNAFSHKSTESGINVKRK